MKLKRLLPVAIIVFVSAFICSCKDDDPKFTSADGDWVYTTPDSKMTVKFSITTASGAITINGTNLIVDGVNADLVTIASGISSMRFSANDAKLTFPYYINSPMVLSAATLPRSMCPMQNIPFLTGLQIN